MHLECTETQDTSINCLHSTGPNGVVPYAKRQEHGLQAMGTFPGPEVGENTRYLEKNIIVLEKKKIMGGREGDSNLKSIYAFVTAASAA